MKQKLISPHWRVYETHKKKIVKQAKREKISESEVIRRLIDALKG